MTDALAPPMSRKRKFRNVCLNSTFRIRFVNPLAHFAFIKKWNLVDLYQRFRYGSIRIVYFSAHLLQSIRQTIRCAMPLPAILIVAREFCAARCPATSVPV